MAFARNISKKEKENSEKYTYLTNSAWTPPASGSSNLKVFEERRTLLGHWFDKWTDSQRRQVIDYLLTKCKRSQLQHIQLVLTEKVPVTNCDFTVLLPRKLSVKIFSLLDPRSLCRASNCCWRWKDITDLDIIWKRKCLRFGWSLSDDTAIEHTRGTCKRLYIENVQKMRFLAIKPPTPIQAEDSPKSSPKMKKKRKSVRLHKQVELNQDSINNKTHEKISQDDNQQSKRPPWKGPDPRPTDSHRKLQEEDKIRRKAVPLMVRSVTALKSSLNEDKEGKLQNRSTREGPIVKKKEKAAIVSAASSRANTPGASIFTKQAWQIVDTDSD